MSIILQSYLLNMWPSIVNLQILMLSRYNLNEPQIYNKHSIHWYPYYSWYKCDIYPVNLLLPINLHYKPLKWIECLLQDKEITSISPYFIESHIF
jgi:hypothetical protein